LVVEKIASEFSVNLEIFVLKTSKFINLYIDSEALFSITNDPN